MPLTYPVAPDLHARLDFAPIDHLLAAAREGYRLYELYRLCGPEELMHYVDALIESPSAERYLWWPRACQAETGASTLRSPALAPIWFEAPPEALLQQARHQADARWPEIEQARRHCRDSLDELLLWELGLVDANEHPNDVLLRKAGSADGIQRHFRLQVERRFSDDVYRLVEGLLGQPSITGYTQRGHGDLHLLKLACREQRRRGGTLSMFDDNPFPVRILGRRGGPSYDPDDDRLVALDPYPAWTGNVRWQYEGLKAQGLFFDEGGYGGMTHGEMEQFEPRNDIGGIIATYPDPRASTERDWIRRPDGVEVGLLQGTDLA